MGRAQHEYEYCGPSTVLIYMPISERIQVHGFLEVYATPVIPMQPYQKCQRCGEQHTEGTALTANLKTSCPFMKMLSKEPLADA